MNGTMSGDNKHDEGDSQDRGVMSPSSPNEDGDDLPTRALRFLSTASNETLGGIAVGLAACTYLVLGRVGLILLGGLGGVVLHATWEGHGASNENVDEARKEKGIDIVKRILDMREDYNNTLSREDPDWGSDTAAKILEGFRPETSAALNELVDAVIRDYVKWWYNPILPGETHFPATSRRTLIGFIASISQHLSKKRPADTFLDFLTNSSSIVIVFLTELSNALTASPGVDMSLTECVYAYLADNPDSNLKTVLSTEQQAKKFKMVADDILQNFLEKSSLDCGPARTFLKEILAGVILEMTLKSCSKPEWINGWIVYLLEEGEPDISQAIDAGMNTPGLVPDVTAKEWKRSSPTQNEDKGHKRRVSKAEEAMEEAMEEAKRLSQLIADDDAKKVDGLPKSKEDIRSSPLNRVPDDERPVLPERPDTSDQLPARLSSTKATTTHTKSDSFTSFDQIVPHAIPVALQADSTTNKRATLTLHNANIMIHDDSVPGDKGRIRGKPTGDFLIQIEPGSSQHPGWMIVRKYGDFEVLHEVLRRIAQISGAASFTEQHSYLPNWKEYSKASLRGELERYLRDACWFQPLAESEGMKRFLEKDQGQMTIPSGKTGGPVRQAPSALENMGKGVLDVLTSAPKGAAEGGKVVLGGVTGVFGSLAGQKKANGTSVNTNVQNASRISTSSLPRTDSVVSSSGSRKSGASEDSVRGTPVIQSQPYKLPPMERRPSQPSLLSETSSERESRGTTSGRSSMSGRRSATHSRESSRAPSMRGTPLSSPTQGHDDSDIPVPPLPIRNGDESSTYDRMPTFESLARVPVSTNPLPSLAETVVKEPAKKPHLLTPKRPPAPLTEEETRVAVELLFAVVNELYTLSSAWNIRRTLLNAAKTFLLRPGNPSLSSIRLLIQDSIIASNISDAGIAGHIRKLREYTLPTEAELKSWPAEMSMEEKERLRIKARKLLVERGLPTALTGVMGQAATGEAMGRVFDCLQMEEMARGLIFGLLLQGVRAVTH